MSWHSAPLGKLADVQLGKMLDQKKNQDEYRRYLGNDNVRWNELKIDEVKKMQIKDSERERFRLKPGDLLICGGGDPGRCALWMSDEEMYYQKALNRVRVSDEIGAQYIDDLRDTIDHRLEAALRANPRRADYYERQG